MRNLNKKWQIDQRARKDGCSEKIEETWTEEIRTLVGKLPADVKPRTMQLKHEAHAVWAKPCVYPPKRSAWLEKHMTHLETDMALNSQDSVGSSSLKYHGRISRATDAKPGDCDPIAWGCDRMLYAGSTARVLMVNATEPGSIINVYDQKKHRFSNCPVQIACCMSICIYAVLLLVRGQEIRCPSSFTAEILMTYPHH